MKRLIPRTLILAAAIALSSVGCFLIRLDPVTDEEFSVRPVNDPARKITFLEPMVWSNAPQYRATKGVRLLDGIYELEAETDDFLYFRAPVHIEMRVLENGVPIDGRDYEGGLALAKAFVSLTPAVAYVSMSPDRNGSDLRKISSLKSY